MFLKLTSTFLQNKGPRLSTLPMAGNWKFHPLKRKYNDVHDVHPAGEKNVGMLGCEMKVQRNPSLKAYYRNVMSSWWWLLVSRGASQIMCPGPTEQQACGLSQTQRCKRTYAVDIINLKFAMKCWNSSAKMENFHLLYMTVVCQVPFSSALF